MNCVAFWDFGRERARPAGWPGCRSRSRSSDAQPVIRFGAVGRLELVEPRAVDDAGDDLAHVDRHLQIGRRQAQQVFGIVERLFDVGGRRRARASSSSDWRRSRGRSAARPARRRPGSRTGPRRAECISAPPSSSSFDSSPVAIFTSGGPPKKHLGALFDEHGVVAHGRRVGAAGRRVAEHQRDRRNAQRPTAASGGETTRRRAERSRTAAASRRRRDSVSEMCGRRFCMQMSKPRMPLRMV